VIMTSNDENVRSCKIVGITISQSHVDYVVMLTRHVTLFLCALKVITAFSIAVKLPMRMM